MIDLLQLGLERHVKMKLQNESQKPLPVLMESLNIANLKMAVHCILYSLEMEWISLLHWWNERLCFWQRKLGQAPHPFNLEHCIKIKGNGEGSFWFLKSGIIVVPKLGRRTTSTYANGRVHMHPLKQTKTTSSCPAALDEQHGFFFSFKQGDSKGMILLV